jgi:hypothetical protein
MLARLFLPLALWLTLSSPARAFDLPVPVDKAAHFGACYVITDQLMRAGMKPEHAVAATLFIGWAKEVTDRPFDPYDLAADTLGALAAGYLRLSFKF